MSVHGTASSQRALSLILGLVGVAAFSLTLPVTRIAVTELDPTFIASGRAIVAALLAAVALITTGSPRPRGRQWLQLLGTAGGVVIGFPLLATWAMLYVPAAHGAVITGLLPLVTALFATAIVGERPKAVFWLSTLVGSAAIVWFSLWSAGGTVEIADLLLLGAVASASYGYAEGARLSKQLGSWQTISWALIVASPLMLIPAWYTMPESFNSLSGSGIASFAYVSVVSMYLGFFAWYRALAIGGIASVGQLQLLQPFMTMLGAALLLGESITLMQCAIAAIVMACVFIGRKAG